MAFVNFVDCCLGSVSNNVQRVDFAMDALGDYRVRVVLLEESPEDRMEFQEVLEDFEAAERDFPGSFKIALEIIISQEGLHGNSFGDGYLGVYRAKKQRDCDLEADDDDLEDWIDR